MKWLAMILALIAVTSPVLARSFVYVSVGGEKRIAVYERDTKTGKLKYLESVQLEGSPGAQGVHPSKKYLYASVRTAKKIAAFRIDPKSGMLKKFSEVSTGMNPVYVSTDRTGKTLLTASYSEGNVMSFPILTNGGIGAKPISVHETAKNAHAILTDPSNKFAYIPHTGPKAVYQFRFDAATGKLTPNNPPIFEFEYDIEPRHLWFHPSLKNIVYFDDEKGSAALVCRMDPKTGSLSLIQSVSSLPSVFKGKNTNADIEMTPDGKFLYISNRGHDSIAGFRVDSKTGKVQSIDQFFTEKTPRSFNIDPTGRFLYAAGQGSGKLAAYTINQKDGSLKRFATYQVGKGPSWVTVLDLE